MNVAADSSGSTGAQRFRKPDAACTISAPQTYRRQTTCIACPIRRRRGAMRRAVGLERAPAPY